MPQRRSVPLVVPKGYGIVLKAAREPKMGRVPGAAGNVPSSPALAFIIPSKKLRNAKEDQTANGTYRRLGGPFLPALAPVVRLVGPTERAGGSKQNKKASANLQRATKKNGPCRNNANKSRFFALFHEIKIAAQDLKSRVGEFYLLSSGHFLDLSKTVEIYVRIRLDCI
ncbi:hypothetical protein SAMN04487970_102716 [Paenibacillus tianmuensis]|uniref:Uncharacterized protein n=1 Tax=Paenibacillus tianmuensis TaxID=624147 RepID=A0A1G4SGH7_9BACL|nr:hypothetical protein [Paenibacillus tianmuensis]SCW67429.1 hypothetical protein SAMN04487970_102716 [Paenibacillus tianmuensis]